MEENLLQVAAAELALEIDHKFVAGQDRLHFIRKKINKLQRSDHIAVSTFLVRTCMDLPWIPLSSLLD